jgi:hypothetical protein
MNVSSGASRPTSTCPKDTGEFQLLHRAVFARVEYIDLLEHLQLAKALEGAHLEDPQPFSPSHRRQSQPGDSGDVIKVPVAARAKGGSALFSTAVSAPLEVNRPRARGSRRPLTGRRAARDTRGLVFRLMGDLRRALAGVYAKRRAGEGGKILRGRIRPQRFHRIAAPNPSSLNNNCYKLNLTLNSDAAEGWFIANSPRKTCRRCLPEPSAVRPKRNLGSEAAPSGLPSIDTDCCATSSSPRSTYTGATAERARLPAAMRVGPG